jgi:DNA mismatch repair ATPase MutL
MRRNGLAGFGTTEVELVRMDWGRSQVSVEDIVSSTTQCQLDARSYCLPTDTSKAYTITSLDDVSTFGFRGEGWAHISHENYVR